MSYLRRVKVDNFDLDKAISLAELEKVKNDSLFLNANILTISDVFHKWENIKLFPKKLELFLNGVKLNCDKTDGIYLISNEFDEVLGTGIIKENLLKRDVII